MNLIDVAKQFATPEACNDFLQDMRWPDGVECVHCNGKRVTKYTKKESTRLRKNAKTGEQETKVVPARILYVCLDCKKQFSVTEGTIFNDTHLSLEKWFHAVAIMVNAKKGVSALQLKRDLGTAYKTSWYLGMRIRKAMNLIELAENEPLSGIVEADETYVGGKYDKRRKRAKYDKAPVFGVVERGGRARTFHVPEVTIKTLIGKIKDNVAISADALFTDDSKYYLTAAGCLQNHNHQTVNHGTKEWVRGDVHTNSVEGYWGLLKRGIIGSFHQISVKHLNRYLSEFQFKWNHRKSQEIFMLVVAALVIGSRLKYDDLIGKTAEPTEQNETPETDVPF